MDLERLEKLSRPELIDVVGQLGGRVESLEHQCQLLRKMLLAPRSERRVLTPEDLRQGSLFSKQIEALDAKLEKVDRPPDAPKRRGKAKRRAGFPKSIPRKKVIYDLPEEARRCSCGETLVDMGADEITEILERIEFSEVHEIHRKKYCCRGCQSGVTLAPGPTRIVPKGILGNSFCVHTVIDKYQHHMPLHRQETKYAAEGLRVSRSVLCETTRRCDEILGPIFEEHKAQVLSADYLKADETPVTQKDPSKKAGSRKAFLWAYLSPGEGVVFDFRGSRSNEGPRDLLIDVSGFLQADAYRGYDETCAREGVTRIGCWVHVRRKFIEAEASDAEFAQEAIRLIGRIYDVDRYVRDRPPDERHAFRQEYAPPLLDDFAEWLELRATQVLAGSPLHGAIRYAREQWATLIVFLQDGRIDLDNNTVEQQLRHVAVGRKNWTHLANENGGLRCALFYSLIQSCKLLGQDPRTYLMDVLIRRLEGEDPAVLTPRAWADARCASAEPSLLPA